MNVKVEKPKQFPFHMIQLVQVKQTLTNDGPTLVTVRIVHDHLTGNHHGRQEQGMASSAPCSGELRLEPLEQVERMVGDPRR